MYICPLCLIICYLAVVPVSSSWFPRSTDSSPSPSPAVLSHLLLLHRDRGASGPTILRCSQVIRMNKMWGNWNRGIGVACWSTWCKIENINSLQINNWSEQKCQHQWSSKVHLCFHFIQKKRSVVCTVWTGLTLPPAAARAAVVEFEVWKPWPQMRHPKFMRHGHHYGGSDMTPMTPRWA